MSKQQGFIQYLLILTLLIGIAVAVYLTQFTQIFKPHASENRLCSANSPASFQTCINKVNWNQADVVEVQNMITCNKIPGATLETNKSECEFNLNNIHRPVLIQGKKGTRAGFARRGWFQKPILYIANSENIYIGNLVFDEDNSVKCERYANYGNPDDPNNRNSCVDKGVCSSHRGCEPTISLADSTDNIVFDKVEVLYFKDFGIYIHAEPIDATGDGAWDFDIINDTSKTGHFKVLNSLFKSSEDLYTSGPMIGRANGSGWWGLTIERSQFEVINNRFENIQSGAAGFSTNATADNHSVIKGNVFKNIAGKDLNNSSGGTFGFFPFARYTDVLYNEVIDGKSLYNIHERAYRVNGGIEIDALDPKYPEHNLNFTGNVIHNIEGLYGIGIGSESGDRYFKDLLFANNVIYDIRAPEGYTSKAIDIQGHGPLVNVTIAANNCYHAGCPIPSYTTLTAFPDSCFIDSTGKCKSTVRWSSKSLDNIVLKDHKTGNPIPSAQGATGSVDFSWTNSSGEGVDLYSNNQLINTLVIKDGKLTEQVPFRNKGNIRTEPPGQCSLNAQGECSVRVIWDATEANHAGIQVDVRVRGFPTPFNSGNITGDQRNDHITAAGSWFELFVDGSLYDAIFVKGIDPGTLPPASNLAFVFTGESNAGGKALNTDATANEVAPTSAVKILNNANFTFQDLDIGTNNLVDHAYLTSGLTPNPNWHGLELGLANAVKAQVFPGTSSVYLIKTGQGLSYLNEWNAGGAYWAKFLQRINAAKPQLPQPVKWVVWYSFGINDILGQNSVSNFKAFTKAHLDKIKAELPGAVVVMTQFQSTDFPAGYSQAAYNTALAELAISEPNVYVVNTGGAALGSGDRYHWSYTGLKTIASRMVDITKTALNRPAVSPSPSPSPSPTGTLTASPNPCQMTATQSVCTSKITWNVTNPNGNVVVKVRETGQGFAGGALSGTADATGINATGVTFDLYSGTTLLKSLVVKGVRVDSAPIGIFDGVFGTQLIGWACDLDVPATAPWVHLYIDDKYVSVYKADKTGAAGIAANCGGYPDRRFVIDIPNQYKDGKPHSAKVYAIDNITNGTNTLTNGSPKTFTLKKGDLNGDGNVTLADFNAFARDYKNKDLRADFNSDGKVDLADLNVLIRNFNK